MGSGTDAEIPSHGRIPGKIHKHDLISIEGGSYHIRDVSEVTIHV